MRRHALAILLAAAAAPAFSEWQLVDDPFPALRQETSGGSVTIPCAHPEDPAFSAWTEWPKPLSRQLNDPPAKAFRLWLPDESEPRILIGSGLGTTGAVKLERGRDGVLSRLSELADAGAGVVLEAADAHGGIMRLTIDLSGWPQAAAALAERCAAPAPRRDRRGLL